MRINTHNLKHQCPYLTSSDEGTSFCALAQVNAEEVSQLRKVAQVIQDPSVQFGRPCATGTGVPSDAIASRFLGGDSISELSVDYGISHEQIEVALRYELAVCWRDSYLS
ncbi:DUF433 domain-containing protein [Aliterella atlantica]|uniref:DUF433 domain-containing protein n=1 Tax=Aliterella atlantica CENA595 TaxID=1618023 RepID=A0A0D8ZKP5_9CYAN|nr:DUF433 domain-containing protein [Aliterella atlantica]KJH69413.1 hypothetical protein UH38_24045 [Aliterella atlantica CENA595]